VTSHYASDLSSVDVDVVCYNAAHNLVGGGSGSVDLLAAGSSAGFSASLSVGDAAPASCVGYAVPLDSTSPGIPQ
jgi:hypothetical protein